VLAKVSAPGLGESTAATGNTVTIAAPFTNLTGAIVSVPASARPGKRATVLLRVDNQGNVDVTQTVPTAVAVSLQPDGVTDAFAAGTVPLKLSLKAGTSKVVKLPLSLPANVVAIPVYVTATLDANSVVAETNEDDNFIVSGTAVQIV
jgi:hypothetical protein